MSTLVLGTAGHIDHGKTALVRALTGIDTDRLPEEKQRGITIDLGFASLRIGDDSFAIVDVPGHEDFIRNMVAGATGLDAVMLIVAADEGVMPQTREHLAILDLLNVQAGVVAITKTDLVTDDWLEMVCDDVREMMAATPLRDAPLVPVSARTGAGIDDLKAAIAEQAARPAARRSDDLFRMPIDRVFTVRGTGTVITGTVWSGTVSVDDSIIIQPPGLRARIRGLEVHGRAVDNVGAGVRAAMALAGVDKSAVARGDVAVTSAAWQPARMLTLRARAIAGQEWSIEQRQRVRVHVGTAEALARVVVLDGSVLEPGQEGWVQLRMETPIVARTGDRVVLRSYSPVTTIGGGIIADISPPKRSTLSEDESERLERIISGSAADAVNTLLAGSGALGLMAADLAVNTAHRPADIERVLDSENVVRIGERCFASGVVEDVVGHVVAGADRLHRENPLRPSLDRSELRGVLRPAAPELVEHAIDTAIRRGDITVAGGLLRRTGFKPTLTERQVAARGRLTAALEAAGLAAPSVSELAGGQGNEAETILLLRLLEQEGVVRAINPELFVDAMALAAARQRVTALAGSALAAADFRTALPVSRKHLIPLLEYFDRTGVTRREGDLRTIVARSEDG